MILLYVEQLSFVLSVYLRMLLQKSAFDANSSHVILIQNYLNELARDVTKAVVTPHGLSSAVSKKLVQITVGLDELSTV